MWADFLGQDYGRNYLGAHFEAHHDWPLLCWYETLRVHDDPPTGGSAFDTCMAHAHTWNFRLTPEHAEALVQACWPTHALSLADIERIFTAFTPRLLTATSLPALLVRTTAAQIDLRHLGEKARFIVPRLGKPAFLTVLPDAEKLQAGALTLALELTDRQRNLDQWVAEALDYGTHPAFHKDPLAPELLAVAGTRLVSIRAQEKHEPLLLQGNAHLLDGYEDEIRRRIAEDTPDAISLAARLFVLWLRLPPSKASTKVQDRFLLKVLPEALQPWSRKHQSAIASYLRGRNLDIWKKWRQQHLQDGFMSRLRRWSRKG